jgi:hypothetical protein
LNFYYRSCNTGFSVFDTVSDLTTKIRKNAVH